MLYEGVVTVVTQQPTTVTSSVSNLTGNVAPLQANRRKRNDVDAILNAVTVLDLICKPGVEVSLEVIYDKHAFVCLLFSLRAIFFLCCS